MKLNVLEGCIDANYPNRISVITAGQYLNQRLVELGLIKI